MLGVAGAVSSTRAQCSTVVSECRNVCVCVCVCCSGILLSIPQSYAHKQLLLQDFNPKAERTRGVPRGGGGSGGVTTTRTVKAKGPSAAASAAAAARAAAAAAPGWAGAGGAAGRSGGHGARVQANRASAQQKAAQRAAQHAAHHQRMHPHMAPVQHRPGGGHMSAVVPTNRCVCLCVSVLFSGQEGFLCVFAHLPAFIVSCTPLAPCAGDCGCVWRACVPYLAFLCPSWRVPARCCCHAFVV